MSMPTMPCDRLLDDDLVEIEGEGAVQAEDQAGPDRVLEHRPVHPPQGCGNDVVQVLLAVSVSLHGVEAKLRGRDVVLAIGAADDFVDGPLHRQRRRLDQLGPMEQPEVAVEGMVARRRGGDHLAELPVVLRRELDALFVGDAPHHGRRDSAAEVAVKLGERHAAGQLAGHWKEHSHSGEGRSRRRCRTAGTAWLGHRSPRDRARRCPTPPDPGDI